MENFLGHLDQQSPTHFSVIVPEHVTTSPATSSAQELHLLPPEYRKQTVVTSTSSRRAEIGMLSATCLHPLRKRGDRTLALVLSSSQAYISVKGLDEDLTFDHVLEDCAFVCLGICFMGAVGNPWPMHFYFFLRGWGAGGRG